VLVLADGTEDQAADSVVAFCDEGSAERGGEVVCEVLAPGSGAFVRALLCFVLLK
jgi:dihydroxyacetone kinase DhaKLM complex PTS-EIIA-like component DhaM